MSEYSLEALNPPKPQHLDSSTPLLRFGVDQCAFNFLQPKTKFLGRLVCSEPQPYTDKTYCFVVSLSLTCKKSRLW